MDAAGLDGRTLGPWQWSPDSSTSPYGSYASFVDAETGQTRTVRLDLPDEPYTRALSLGWSPDGASIWAFGSTDDGGSGTQFLEDFDLEGNGIGERRLVEPPPAQTLATFAEAAPGGTYLIAEFGGPDLTSIKPVLDTRTGTWNYVPTIEGAANTATLGQWFDDEHHLVSWKDDAGTRMLSVVHATGSVVRTVEVPALTGDAAPCLISQGYPDGVGLEI